MVASVHLSSWAAGGGGRPRDGAGDPRPGRTLVRPDPASRREPADIPRSVDVTVRMVTLALPFGVDPRSVTVPSP
jgi:hypothetical protein